MISENLESQLFKISKGYFQGKPPIQIKCLPGLIGTAHAQNLQILHERTIGRPGLQMPVQYRTTFVKFVINQVEKHTEPVKPTVVEFYNDKDEDKDEEDDEVPGLDLWYTELEKISASPAESFFRLYDINNKSSNSSDPIKIFEHENTFVSEGTTGFMTWEASTQFSNWILKTRPSWLLDTNWAIELGSGTGLLGIRILKAFPNITKYIATDGSEGVLENCHRNFTTNLSTSVTCTKVLFEKLDWVLDTEKFKRIVDKTTAEAGIGVLLGADIVFDVTLIPHLVTFINIFLDTQVSSCCLLSCTIRNEKTMAVLQKELENLASRNFNKIYSWKSQEDETGIIFEIR